MAMPSTAGCFCLELEAVPQSNQPYGGMMESFRACLSLANGSSPRRGPVSLATFPACSCFLQMLQKFQRSCKLIPLSSEPSGEGTGHEQAIYACLPADIFSRNWDAVLNFRVLGHARGCRMKLPPGQMAGHDKNGLFMLQATTPGQSVSQALASMNGLPVRRSPTS